MKGEFGFRANHYKEFEKEFEREKVSWTEEQKEEARAETDAAWQDFWAKQRRRDAELEKQPQYMDVERYLAFWETIRILREEAAWSGHRMTYEVKDDRSYGCIRYYADEIIHIGDDAGDHTRQLWSEIFPPLRVCPSRRRTAVTVSRFPSILSSGWRQPERRMKHEAKTVFVPYGLLLYLPQYCSAVLPESNSAVLFSGHSPRIFVCC